MIKILRTENIITDKSGNDYIKKMIVMITMIMMITAIMIMIAITIRNDDYKK